MVLDSYIVILSLRTFWWRATVGVKSKWLTWEAVAFRQTTFAHMCSHAPIVHLKSSLVFHMIRRLTCGLLAVSWQNCAQEMWVHLYSVSILFPVSWFLINVWASVGTWIFLCRTCIILIWTRFFYLICMGSIRCYSKMIPLQHCWHGWWGFWGLLTQNY